MAKENKQISRLPQAGPASGCQPPLLTQARPGVSLMTRGGGDRRAGPAAAGPGPARAEGREPSWAAPLPRVFLSHCSQVSRMISLWKMSKHSLTFEVPQTQGTRTWPTSAHMHVCVEAGQHTYVLTKQSHVGFLLGPPSDLLPGFVQQQSFLRRFCLWE